MFGFLKKIKIPKTTLTCLVIVAIVLVALYFTGFINKDKLPFEHYEDAAQDEGIADKIKNAWDIVTS